MSLQFADENKRKLQELVTVFHDNIKQYKSSVYDEANTKTDFIDKFFEVMDWDVRNTQGFNEDYREVVREDKVQIEGKPSAPDYSFKIGKERKFFVEAKKPFIKIKEEISPAYQVRRYGYTAKLPLSILTDFEEFAVYDTRIKPVVNDSPATARIFYCTYDEYEKHIDFIYNTFSKTAILKGSFDQYIAENKNKKGTSEVDKEFLKTISEWRELLAKNIALRNSDIDIYALNTAIQKIIDRLIFFRIAEDRGTENYKTLFERIKTDCYKCLIDLFAAADQKYNSELFKADDFINGLTIDDSVFKTIIKEMYFPDCPYEFSVLPIEVLGNIYEQFLGKTIRLTAGHQAKIEEKPEVRKAGGVYYTPQYIVNYIVENTVGEKIKGKTPEQITDLKILDPACGSGSFLIGAYTYLLDYHISFYTEEKRLKKSLKDGKIYQVKENDYHLTTEEKQKILLSNIYGVDIDPQAVEVTKLSLLLKLMEYETIESRGELFKHSDYKILPNLSNNIKCGNSLIGSDFYTDKDLSLFGMEEMRKVNVFDWGKEFTGVMGKGGFDVVIGNPPYISIEDLSKKEGDYFLSNYQTAKGRVNTFSLFLEKIIKILNKNYLAGFIISNRLLTNSQLDILRYYLLTNYMIKEIVTFNEMVFKDASVNTILISLEDLKNKNYKISIKNDRTENTIKLEKDNKISSLTWLSNPNYIFNVKQSETATELLEIIEKDSTILSNICEIKDGIILGSIKDLFLSDKKIDDRYEKFLAGNCVSRYSIEWDGKWICYDKKLIEKELEIKYKQYKNIKEDFDEFKKKSRPGIWLRDRNIFEQSKIITRQNAKRIIGTYDNSHFFVKNSLHSILTIDNNYNLKYILALLNSKLLDFYFQNKIGSTGELFSQMKIEYLRKLPIYKLDFLNKKNTIQHDTLVSLVDQMLETQKSLHSVKTEADKKVYQQKADLIDKQIDALVYKLYGLTEDEIKIVEEN